MRDSVVDHPQLNRNQGVLPRRPGNEKPPVSIITPFLNAENFFQEAIESVLAQSYDPWELLLVDDGSSDRSTEIARSYAAQYPARIRWLEHAGHDHRGAGAARNLGLRWAAGQYLTFLDADDVYLPGKLEKEVAVLEAQPEAAAVCGALQYWYSWTGERRDARRDFIRRLGVRPETLHRPPHLLVHHLRAGGHKPGISSLMVRREAVAQVGAFEPETFRGLGEDQVFWARVSLHVPVFVMGECLFRYRQHADSTCAVAIREGRDAAAWQSFLNWLETYLADEGVTNPEVWKALRACQRDFDYQVRFAVLKQLGRRLLPLRTRYWLRDRWTSWRL